MRKEGFSASALRAMGMAVSNSGFIGYPILGQRFGLRSAATTRQLYAALLNHAALLAANGTPWADNCDSRTGCGWNA